MKNNRSLKHVLRKFDNKYGFGMLENLFAINWFNPFATIWLNFRSLPVSQAWRLPVSVYGRPRFYNLSGSMRIEGKAKFGMISFNKSRPGSPSLQSVQSELFNQGTIIFRGPGEIGTGNKIRVTSNATLELGSYFKITDMVNVGCYTNIHIGERTWIVHRCQVLDANYHSVANFQKRIIPKWARPIYIGKDCWICNSTTITGGAVIPDATIVASNSLAGKDYSEIGNNAMIGGTPAKLIAKGFRRVNNKLYEKAISKYYKENPDGMFQIPEDWTIDECSEIVE